MRISDWSSDVCSSDLPAVSSYGFQSRKKGVRCDPSPSFRTLFPLARKGPFRVIPWWTTLEDRPYSAASAIMSTETYLRPSLPSWNRTWPSAVANSVWSLPMPTRSEEHTSELQSLMRISYAVFCLKKKKKQLKRILYKEHTNSTQHF